MEIPISNTGFYCALVFAAIASLGMMRAIAETESRNGRESHWSTIVILVIVISGAVLAISSIVLPIHNVISNRHLLSTESVISELQSGTLALRIVSVVCGITSLFALRKVYPSTWRVVPDKGRTAQQSESHTEFRKWFKSAPRGVNIAAQYIFYVASIISLWILTLSGIDTPIIAIAKWAMFFIVDDWIVISTYTDVAASQVRPFHKWGLLAFNAVIFTTVVLGMSIVDFRIAVLVGCGLLALLTASCWDVKPLHVKRFLRET